MNQSADFTALIQYIYKVSIDINEVIYGAKSEAFNQTGDVNTFNLPAVLDPAVLNVFVEDLRDINEVLETNANLAKEAKNPNNIQVIKGYYENIATALNNIDYRQTPAFKNNITKEFNRFNSIMFNAPNSFSYPEPMANEPEYSPVETDVAGALKNKAKLAAGALRSAVDYATKGTPQKHPGWDNNNWETWKPGN